MLSGAQLMSEPTKPQDYAWTPQDQAGNAQAAVNSNRWVAEKKDLKDATDMRQDATGIPSAEVLEEPGHLPPERPHGPVSAETPEAFTGLRLGDPKKKSAGMPGVLKATQYVWQHA